MSREIKFRAWEFKAKLMHPPVDLSAPRATYRWLGNTDLPLMQYTGLKDKNGVEIYEGDIVHLDNGTRNPYQVIWDNSFSGWAFGKTAGLNSLFSLYGAGVFEVIGNIHENPELLEQAS